MKEKRGNLKKKKEPKVKDQFKKKMKIKKRGTEKIEKKIKKIPIDLPIKRVLNMKNTDQQFTGTV